MNKHVKRAMELRNETPMVNNCAQTILRAYAEELGLSGEQAAGMGCNFGGGMKCGGVCGAITSSLMVLGAKGIDKPDRVREFRQRIADNHNGMINCVDLLRANAARGGVKKEHCDAMICEAIELIDEFVGIQEKITLCGDNCMECPRYNAHSDEELGKVAEVWYRVGWRDHIVSNEEIKCEGCSSHKQCTYHLVECIREHHVDKCNQCGEFPCKKINDMLERSKAYQKKCKEVCSDEEYDKLEKAFFNKENNLMK